ncbi:uncharacterized protein BDZ99DRAFT_527471 [Mytilinidion resinicola]|uniref:Uncharacterized protein n=1 Tax=Mytilinidion resinicola TaxID=574789 RepID=A0A6A6Y0V6_9PEZI|nr:uncharacterized protein BDZ99DRAFT_527471 [Mytilinidion resinicola]KAF2802446.1 hypothetical protein BDZ99DRAFT_527471 [Mytilinidion resinicola]
MSSQYNQTQHPQTGYRQPLMMSRPISTLSRQPVAYQDYEQQQLMAYQEQASHILRQQALRPANHPEAAPAQQQSQAVTDYDQYGQMVYCGPAPPLAVYEKTPLAKQKASLTKAAFHTLQLLDGSVRTMMIRGPIHQSTATPMSKLVVLNAHGKTVEADHITVSYKDAKLVASCEHLTAHGYVKRPRSFDVIDATSDECLHGNGELHRRGHKERWPKAMDSAIMAIDLSNPPL